ncbi:MAG: DNA polymerase [bacterium]|nr:DNA polymerase [bacterium]
MAVKKERAGKKGNVSRLVILDSHAIIHRAYHAIPDFSSSKGEPTGALYGLIAMLLKLVDDLKPDYIVACRDLPGKTQRHELFEAYKATRVKAEPELIAQLERAPKVFEAFGIPLYEAPGFEADDGVGSIVSKVSSRRDIETVIASGDLDTLQLVGDRVKVYTLRKGLSDIVLYDEERVAERFGFGPKHMTDYKALRGDQSDNIPGIKGIGEKTATELIQQFGSIEDLYNALKKDPDALEKKGFKARVVQLVREGKDAAAFSKSLATIRVDAPIHFEFPKRMWHLSDHADSIIALCDELEFRSLKERVRAAVQKPSPKGPEAPSLDDRSSSIDQRALKETSLALWLLHSDTTNPDLEDILNFGKTEDFERAREAVFEELRKTGRLNDVFEKIEKPLIPVVERMNEAGIGVDKEYLKNLAREYTKGLGEIAGRIFKHAGREFNINSPKQLATVLFDELKITPERHKKTSTGARTTREDELAKLSHLHPVVGDILAYRELQKLLSTYIEKMPALIGEDGRLHTEFLQAGTTTGRMASQNPNLQNIPIKSEYGRRIRKAFVARKGAVFAALDYSQIELRIAAGLSGDEKLAGVFRRGGDVHAAVASEVFGVPPEYVDYEMRRRAKVINFGILYGMGVNALRSALGESVSREEAARFLSEYFKNYSGLARFIEKTKADAARQGFTETLFGRRRYFPGLKSALPNLVAQAERMAINAPIQGTQSDIIKLAMVEADHLIEKKGWKEKARLILQVHDELVYEVDKDEAETIARELRQVMEEVVPKKDLSDVPILAEIAIGKNWGDTTRIKR